MTQKPYDGQRVRVCVRARGRAMPPCAGVVRFVCIVVDGALIELDAPAPAFMEDRLRFNGGDRLVLVYRSELEPMAVRQENIDGHP